MTEPFVPPPGFALDELFSFDGPRPRAVKQMRRHSHRPNPAFGKLPISVRRNKVVSLGWRIRSDANGLGVFTSHDILPGSREWPLEAGGVAWWADVYFLKQGRRPATFFNATVMSLAKARAERVVAAARAAVEARTSPDDRKKAALRCYSRRLPRGGSEMVFAPPEGLASLGGLTEAGASAEWLRAHWDERQSLAAVGESARFDRSYVYGVGLTLTTAEPNLSVDGVARAIAAFRERGETEYELPFVDSPDQARLLDDLLAAELWYWDNQQARAEGRELAAPEADGVLAALNQSNAIRMERLGQRLRQDLRESDLSSPSPD